MENVAGYLVLSGALGFVLGYMLGRWSGFTDAQPKRDKRGRFIKRF